MSGPAVVNEVDVPSRTVVALEARRDLGPLGTSIRAAFDRLYRSIEPQEGQRFGKNILFYDKGDRFVAGVTDAVIRTPDNEISVRTLAGGHAVHAVHVGDYARMDEAYQAIGTWMAERMRRGSGRSLEVYDHVDPSGAQRPRTDVYVFLGDAVTA